ncbi:flagellar filament outer layer protein FlaA [Treponema brennaborense]|nr:flagellar filament outer layer protein FlaA [Treponema brennaborense]
MVLFCVPVFGQPSVKSVETISIDNFDTADAMEWSWAVQSSRFVTEGFPKLAYIDGMPNSLTHLSKSGDPDPKVLGVKVEFDRKGDNWFEVYPVAQDENGNTKNYEIPFIGITSQIDFWVWGANYLYFLEVLVRDADGRVHVLPACNLAFEGWRNVIVKIPTYIRQQSRLRSGPEHMSFVGFRVRSDPNEFVDDFVIYFDNLKYTTNVLETIYDGYNLRKLDFGSDTGN